jgi:F-type H+-transporting ATPase subunit gamma
VGADIRALKNRIKSIDSTLHLTKAMGLVASSKLKRAMDGMRKSSDYANAFKKVIENLASDSETRENVFFKKSASDKVRLIVIAGDRGLAGGYNANVFRLVKTFEGVEFFPIGKRACDKLGGKTTVYAEKFTYQNAIELSKQMLLDFQEGKFGKLGIVCTKYRSMLSQEAVVEWVLPFEITANESCSMVFEPDEKSVLEAVVPEYLAGVIISAVRESFASEISARRTAMDSAGKNAKQMIDDLSIEYNRARQGAITQEITEIIAGV